MTTPERLLNGATDVLIAVIIVAALAVAAGVIYLRALDHELDHRPTNPTVTTSEETGQP